MIRHTLSLSNLPLKMVGALYSCFIPVKNRQQYISLVFDLQSFVPGARPNALLMIHNKDETVVQSFHDFPRHVGF